MAADAASSPRVLLVRLSSLGDVVHALPVLADLAAERPAAQVDWAIEEAFAPLLRCVSGVAHALPVALRRWRRTPLRSGGELQAFWRSVRRAPYDRIVDLQGLVKSASVARAAVLAPGGRRVGIGNRTEGSGYEPLARWTYDLAVPMPWRIHVVERTRRLVAEALGYAPAGAPRVPWALPPVEPVDARWAEPRGVLLVHGSAMAEKLMPVAFWVALGRRLHGLALQPLLPWGTADERARADRIAAEIGGDAAVMPRLPLDRLTAVMGRQQGCIGLDTGISHIASALGKPTVQVFMTDQAWRVGAHWQPRTALLPARSPDYTVDEVLAAWGRVA